MRINGVQIWVDRDPERPGLLPGGLCVGIEEWSQENSEIVANALWDLGFQTDFDWDGGSAFFYPRHYRRYNETAI